MLLDKEQENNIDSAIKEELSRIEREALTVDTSFEGGKEVKKINWLARTAFLKFGTKGSKSIVPTDQQIYEDLQLSRSALELSSNGEWDFNDAEADPDSRKKDDEDRFQHFSKFFNLTEESRLLEIGMRNGHFMNFLQNKKLRQITGVDCVKINVLYCLKKGFDVYHIDAHELSKQFRPLTFDAVFAYHILEHCYDPDKVLSECNAILKNGGGIHIEIPIAKANIRWGHCYGFKRKELAKKLKKNGFEVLDIVYTDSNFERTVARKISSSKRTLWSRIFS